MQWTYRVVHRFRSPMAFGGGPKSYPQQGISLIFEEGKIVGVEHLLPGGDLPSRESAGLRSSEVLSPLFDAIAYWSGYDTGILERTVESIGKQQESSTTTQFHGADAMLVNPVRLPDEGLFMREHGRFPVWLRLAVEARPPASAENAIRNYFMILEDLNLTKEGEGQELRWTRNFVSHAVITWKGTLKFLEKKLGPGTNRFDPTDPRHQEFVEFWRQRARKLVEAAINKELFPG